MERRQIVENVSRDRPILVYCLSTGCRFDDTIAMFLAREGFKHISIYPGGWTEWRESEYNRQ
jgi:rhodanese-related sulfurtransferase